MSVNKRWKEIVFFFNEPCITIQVFQRSVVNASNILTIFYLFLASSKSKTSLDLITIPSFSNIRLQMQSFLHCTCKNSCGLTQSHFSCQPALLFFCHSFVCPSLVSWMFPFSILTSYNLFFLLHLLPFVQSLFYYLTVLCSRSMSCSNQGNSETFPEFSKF